MQEANKVKLSKSVIDKIPYTEHGQKIYWDTELKGFGLKVGRKTKTFIVQRDVLVDGQYKTVKGTIGRYKLFTHEQARDEAPNALKKLAAGKSVKGETATVAKNSVTLKDVYDSFIKNKTLAVSTVKGYKSNMKKFSSADMLIDLMSVPIDELAAVLPPDKVIDLFSTVTEKNGYGAATNSFKNLQGIISYGHVLYPNLIKSNPIRAITDAELWAPAVARKDRLEIDQFRQFYEQLPRFITAHRDCLLLSLYQGLRPIEGQRLEWKDVNMKEKFAFIFHETEETKCSYYIPLCRQSLEILKRRFHTCGDGKYVFPSSWHSSTVGHISPRAEKLAERTGLALTLHGLRRTFIYIASRLFMPRDAVNVITGHLDKSVIGIHYSHLSIEEYRPVGEKVANEIERLLAGKEAKVVKL